MTISIEFRRGAEAAAAMAEQYNAGSSHEYRLDDCILGKLNLRDGKPRKNKARGQEMAKLRAEVDRLFKRVVALGAAIEKHRDANYGAHPGRHIEKEDRALYAVLEGAAK